MLHRIIMEIIKEDKELNDLEVREDPNLIPEVINHPVMVLRFIFKVKKA